MNTEQAKKLDFPDILSRMGYTPVKSVKGGKELWYSSPFRKETEPSFHTSFLGGKWIWNDFGDIGGTIIDFVMRHEGFATVKEALNFLREMHPVSLFQSPSKQSNHTQTSLFSFQQQSGGAARRSEQFSQNFDLEFLGEKPLYSKTIFRYLERRGIPDRLASRYLVLVHYSNHKKPSEKPYFAFGQRNISGGYEIRSADDEGARFKSALICRDITVFRGKDPGSTNVSVFEGMLDHISLLVMLGRQSLKGDVIIMNALSSYNRTLSYIQEKAYQRVDLFLDNDDSGRKATDRFLDDLGKHAIDQSETYSPHKDVNQALIAGLRPVFVNTLTPEP